MRTLPIFLAAALLLTGPAAGAVGWTVGTTPTTAAMAFGAPETASAFRLDCSGGRMSLSTWTSRPPRNVTEGEFGTRLSVFQGKREISLGASGRVLGGGGTRLDALIGDRAAFLDGMGRARRLVVVTFAGRATAPAPDAAQLAAFGEACSTR